MSDVIRRPSRTLFSQTCLLPPWKSILQRNVTRLLELLCRRIFWFCFTFVLVCMFFFSLPVEWKLCDGLKVWMACQYCRRSRQGQLEACNSLRDACGDNVYESNVVPYATEDDTVDKSIQSSRHVDVMKVWLMWRAKGRQGFEAQIEKLMDLSRYYSQLQAKGKGSLYSATSRILQLQRCCSCHRQGGRRAYRP